MEMYNIMANNPHVLTSSNKAGIARVKEMKGGYAFFMESSSIEYIMERDCDLAKVGGELDAKSYGIGMRKNYPYKEEINYAILKLQENGYMHKLKTKWWKQKGAKNCKASFNLQVSSRITVNCRQSERRRPPQPRPSLWRTWPGPSWSSSLG